MDDKQFKELLETLDEIRCGMIDVENEIVESKKIQSPEDVDILQSMQRLDIKNGDILVLQYPGILAPEMTKRLREDMRATIRKGGFDVKVIVLEEGMDIGCLERKNNGHIRSLHGNV